MLLLIVDKHQMKMKKKTLSMITGHLLVRQACSQLSQIISFLTSSPITPVAEKITK